MSWDLDKIKGVKAAKVRVGRNVIATETFESSTLPCETILKGSQGKVRALKKVGIEKGWVVIDFHGQCIWLSPSQFGKIRLSTWFSVGHHVIAVEQLACYTGKEWIGIGAGLMGTISQIASDMVLVSFKDSKEGWVCSDDRCNLHGIKILRPGFEVMVKDSFKSDSEPRCPLRHGEKGRIVREEEGWLLIKFPSYRCAQWVAPTNLLKLNILRGSN